MSPLASDTRLAGGAVRKVRVARNLDLVKFSVRTPRPRQDRIFVCEIGDFWDLFVRESSNDNDMNAPRYAPWKGTER
jgi:hypothetical protein